MSYGYNRFARTTRRSIESGLKQAEINLKAQAWREANPDVAAWLNAKRETFDFAESLASALSRYGSLTPNQLAAAQRCMDRDAQRAAERIERAANAPEADTRKIEIAFAYAQDKGIKRPKMVLNGYKFSLAPAHGMNAGALYVTRTEDDQYLGKIKDGRFQASRECRPEDTVAILRVTSDPHAEALAYGRRTGNCCICNRELTNHASIDAGIGPICAEKYGWA